MIKVNSQAQHFINLVIADKMKQVKSYVEHRDEYKHLMLEKDLCDLRVMQYETEDVELAILINKIEVALSWKQSKQ